MTPTIGMVAIIEVLRKQGVPMSLAELDAAYRIGVKATLKPATINTMLYEDLVAVAPAKPGFYILGDYGTEWLAAQDEHRRTLAQPRRIDRVHGPVYVPPVDVPVRPNALDFKAIPSRGACVSTSTN